MSNHDHQSQYHPADPRGAQPGFPSDADGQARAFGMGNGAGADYGAGSVPSGQGGYGYVHGQPGHAGSPQGQPAGFAPGHAGQPYGYDQYGRLVFMPQAYVAPATSQPVAVQRKRSRKGMWIAIIVAVLCLALAAGLFFFMQDGARSRQGTKGQLEGKSEAEIQAELNRQVEEGMFNISIASVVEFADGASEGELRIENVPGNRYLMKVVITRDDNGEAVYTSDFIEPDYHVQRDTLDTVLPAGTYPCTAVFTAHDPATEDVVGQAAAKITLMVKS